MPELPEVETTMRGIEPYIVGKNIKNIIIRERRLRWLIPENLNLLVKNQCIYKLRRRAKYLFLYMKNGCLIIHLGMSGCLRIVENDKPYLKHDHVDFVFEKYKLCFHDPRRFGSILWTSENPMHHRLIAHLGPEPLSNEFNINYLFSVSKKHSLPIKTFIMNNRVVVGIGNIYANEALFLSGINPKLKANKISKIRYGKLVKSIKTILLSAIETGGTTLRDFVNSNGMPGYFSRQLKVYDRSGKKCMRCDKKIKMIKQNQRSTFYCTNCQT